MKTIITQPFISIIATKKNMKKVTTALPATPSTYSRRKSTITVGRSSRQDERDDSKNSTLELEKLEQEITLVLQDIDNNLSRSNAIINDKIFPILRKYSQASSSAWKNVNFWKYFLEEAAGVEIENYNDDSKDELDKKKTELNTLANAKNNYLLSDDEDPESKEDNQADKDVKSKKSAKTQLQIQEETTTWTAEQQNLLKKTSNPSQFNIQASTPQLISSRPSLPPPNQPSGTVLRFDSNEKTAPTQLQFDSNDTFAPPPQLITADNRGNMFNAITNEPSPIRRRPQIVTLDNNQKILISPKKSSAITRTPLRDTIKGRERSSMIQELINSSPTLPEPPVLLSELGRSSFSKTHSDQSTDKKNTSPTKEATPKSTSDNKRQSLQRFPRTPIFSSGGRDHVRKATGTEAAAIDVSRTPLGVRIRYGDDEDSEIRPPELQNPPPTTKLPILDFNVDNSGDLEDFDVPLPALQTIEIPTKRKSDNQPEGTARKQRNLIPDDDDDNIFLDNTTRPESKNSTLYHSLEQSKDDDTSELSNSSLGPVLSARWKNILNRRKS